MRVVYSYILYLLYLRMRVYRLYLLYLRMRVFMYSLAKNIGEQKIGEEHSAKNVPAKNMTRRNFRNPPYIILSLTIVRTN